MAQHVYHWKHGWIPLTHTAALSKAKGNKTLAAKYVSDAHSPEAGIKNRQHVAHAVRDLPNVPSESRDHARTQVAKAAAEHNAEDLLPSHMRDREARMAREQASSNNAHVVARTRPAPSAADISDAAEQWKRDHPGKKVAGHEAEVLRIANDLWAKKRLKGTDTSATPEQAAAQRERVRLSALHGTQFKALGFDKPKVVELADAPKRPRTAAELEAAARRRRARR